MSAQPRFRLFSRVGCALCDEMLGRLQAMPAAGLFPIDVVDIDEDPPARARYAHKIPVLFFDGMLVCHGHLDAEEVHKALALVR